MGKRKRSINKQNGNHVLNGAIEVMTCRPGVHSPDFIRHQVIEDGWSGGPAYASHTAYGIVSNDEDCVFYLQHARDAQNEMNVNIMVAD
jgi:2-iminoacetate synthase ThiH